MYFSHHLLHNCRFVEIFRWLHVFFIWFPHKTSIFLVIYMSLLIFHEQSLFEHKVFSHNNNHTNTNVLSRNLAIQFSSRGTRLSNSEGFCHCLAKGNNKMEEEIMKTSCPALGPQLPLFYTAFCHEDRAVHLQMAQGYRAKALHCTA